MHIIPSFNLICNTLYNYGARKKIKEIMQKLQNCVLRKNEFKKFHHSIKHVYKYHKSLELTDILNVQNCLLVYQFEQNNALATSFPALHSRDKHNYQTRSATQNLLDVSIVRTNKYGKESVKHQCIRDWDNFKNKFPQIPKKKLSNLKIKIILEHFWSILDVLFPTINFYMCTLCYFYFLSSMVAQLSP